MKFRLIYFDDQSDNISIIQAMLKDQFQIIGFTEPSNLSEIISLNRPHGILLDIHMPIVNGIELHDKIVEDKNYNGCPIFFITSDITVESRLKAARTSAIDYLHRLMSEKEMKLRLINKIKTYLQGTPILEVGNLKLDSNSFTVTVNGVQVDLTLSEMRILSLVMRSMPEPVEKVDMVEKIWGDSLAQGKLYVHLSNLKIKLDAWSCEIKIRGNQVLIVPRQ